MAAYKLKREDIPNIFLMEERKGGEERGGEEDLDLFCGGKCQQFNVCGGVSIQIFPENLSRNRVNAKRTEMYPK